MSHRGVFAAGVALAAIVGTTSVAGASAEPPAPAEDPEQVSELSFTVWALENGVAMHRLSCDVTPGQGDVCFVLLGFALTAYVPTADGAGWQAYVDPSLTAVPSADDTAATDPAAAPGGAGTSIGNGNFIVGTDVVPGTYTAVLDGDPNCWVETFADLTSDQSIDYVYADVPGTYFFEVSSDAVIVNSSGCGTWTLVQS